MSDTFDHELVAWEQHCSFDYDSDYSYTSTYQGSTGTRLSNKEFAASCRKFYNDRGYLTPAQQSCIIRIYGDMELFLSTCRPLFKPDIESAKQDNMQLLRKIKNKVQQTKEEYKMALTEVFLAENPNFKYVSCVFAPYTGTKEYTYKTMLPVAVGDYVVVQTPSKEYQVVRIRSVIDPLEFKGIAGIKYKWIMQIVDTTHYDKCVEIESADDRAAVAKLVRL
jgi:hypothetical protein